MDPRCGSATLSFSRYGRFKLHRKLHTVPSTVLHKSEQSLFLGPLNIQTYQGLQNLIDVVYLKINWK